MFPFNNLQGELLRWGSSRHHSSRRSRWTPCSEFAWMILYCVEPSNPARGSRSGIDFLEIRSLCSFHWRLESDSISKNHCVANYKIILLAYLIRNLSSEEGCSWSAWRRDSIQSCIDSFLHLRLPVQAAVYSHIHCTLRGNLRRGDEKFKRQ